MLKKDFIRDEHPQNHRPSHDRVQRQVCSFATKGTGLQGALASVFHTTRDSRGNLLSVKSSDPGLLIRRK